MPHAKLSLGITLVLLLSGCGSTMQRNASDPQSAVSQLREHAEQSYQLRDYHAAEGSWLALLEKRPNDLQAQCRLGHIYFRQHHYQASLHYLQKCAKRQSSPVATQQTIATIYLRLATQAMLHGSAYLPDESTPATTGKYDQYRRLLRLLMGLQRGLD